MYRVTRGNVDININLPNGIYRFNSESGTGKTYLYHLLNILYDAGCPVIGLTYRDIRDKKFDRLFESNQLDKLKAILFDRYDLYGREISTKYKDKLLAISNKCIILIDAKMSSYLGCADICYAKIVKSKQIEVYGHGISV